MIIRLISFFALVLSAWSAHASIQLSSTRLIFEKGSREVSVTVRNKGDVRLVQSWLDKHQPTDPVPPFAVTPPLAKGRCE